MNQSHRFDEIKCLWIDGEGLELQAFKKLASESPLCVCDLETTGLDPLKNQISVIGVGFQNDSPTFSAFLFDQLARDWSALLRPLLEEASVYKIFHNAKFDWKFLYHQLGIDAGPMRDTLQAAKILDNGRDSSSGGFGLADLAEYYLGLALDKDQDLRTSFTGGPYSERQLHYAAMDLSATSRLWNRLQGALDDKLADILTLEGAAIPPTGSMELNGFRIDLDRLDQLELHIQGELQRLGGQLPLLKAANPNLFSENGDNSTGTRLQPNSPKQIKKYVQEHWGLRLDKTDEKALKRCRHAEAQQFFELILECRQLEKKRNTYLTRFQSLDSDGRLRGRFDPLGTSTGRFSSSGPNLQNIPREEEYRRLFVPDPGHQMIVCDYSQIELRVAAELAGDRMMIEAFQSGQDLHTLTASQMFDKPVKQVSKEERQRAKAVNFGLIYNMKSKRLVDEGISENLKQAKEFIRSFFGLYNDFKAFHAELLNPTLEKSKSGPVDFRTPRSGRRRWLDREDLYWPNGGIRPNVVYNTPVQGLAGDGLKQALGLLWPELQKTSGRLLASVHDELVLEAPQAEAEEVCRITKDAMIKGMQIYLEKVPVQVESAIGDSWAEKA